MTIFFLKYFFKHVFLSKRVKEGFLIDTASPQLSGPQLP